MNIAKLRENKVSSTSIVDRRIVSSESFSRYRHAVFRTRAVMCNDRRRRNFAMTIIIRNDVIVRTIVFAESVVEKTFRRKSGPRERLLLSRVIRCSPANAMTDSFEYALRVDSLRDTRARVRYCS